jgi:hypothetical protein
MKSSYPFLQATGSFHCLNERVASGSPPRRAISYGRAWLGGNICESPEPADSASDIVAGGSRVAEAARLPGMKTIRNFPGPPEALLSMVPTQPIACPGFGYGTVYYDSAQSQKLRLSLENQAPVLAFKSHLPRFPQVTALDAGTRPVRKKANTLPANAPRPGVPLCTF